MRTTGTWKGSVVSLMAWAGNILIGTINKAAGDGGTFTGGYSCGPWS